MLFLKLFNIPNPGLVALLLNDGHPEGQTLGYTAPPLDLIRVNVCNTFIAKLLVDRCSKGC